MPALIAIAAAGAVVLLWRRGRAERLKGASAVADARALLGLSADADAAAVRAAHRRVIARVHPDAGGTAELARRANQARDVLLAELARLRND